MPELPEVETTKQSLAPLIGQKVSAVTVHNSHLRWPVPSDIDQLSGQRLIAVNRRAKYLIAQFEQAEMIWHLGMSGRFCIVNSNDALGKHDHVVFDFESQQLRYNDPRRFGSMLWLDANHQQKRLDPLGPEPLSDDFNADYLLQCLQNKTTAIKSSIMNNHVVVGVGNIYASESLFKAGIHPAMPSKEVSFAQLVVLVDQIKIILIEAIKQGGSSLKDFKNAVGKTGYFQQTLLVYARQQQPCFQCQQPLQKIVIGQRASVFCPNCQPAFEAK